MTTETATEPRSIPMAARRRQPRPDPRPWPFNRMEERTARRLATGILALIGLLLLIGISGLKFVRQPLGYVGVVRNGGPLDDRKVRQILQPGEKLTFTGLFSQAPHNYPSVRSLRTYTVTSDAARGSRPGVDVVSVPTSDGVQVGLEATVFMRFVGESDPEVLKRFDGSVGTRKFTLPSGKELYAWQGNLPGAVAQLYMAMKAGDGDFYQASVVETRLRALRKELQEQQEQQDRTAMSKGG